MSDNLIDLVKKVEICLDKKGFAQDTIAKVGIAMDISGSMSSLYCDGTVQKVVDRCLAVGNKFDDDQSIDMWLFHTKSQQLDSVTPVDFGNFIDNKVIKADTIKWGGTKYAPVMNDIIDYYYTPGIKIEKQAVTKKKGGLFGFGAKEVTEYVDVEVSCDIPPGREDENDKYPVYIAFITDGDCWDEHDIKKILKENMNKNMFIMFIGIGTNASYKLLKKLDKTYDNVGFFQIDDPRNIDDECLYDWMLTDDVCKALKG